MHYVENLIKSVSKVNDKCDPQRKQNRVLGKMLLSNGYYIIFMIQVWKSSYYYTIVHATRSFTLHLRKTNDVQIMNQLFIHVQDSYGRELLDEFLFSENPCHREECFVCFGQ